VFLVPGVRQNGGSTTGDERTLVLAPTQATVLQILVGGQVVGLPTTLTNGIGSIVVAHGQVVQVRALDAAGAVVGTGTGPIGNEDIPEERPPDFGAPVHNWS
jgi:hypothetical protein